MFDLVTLIKAAGYLGVGAIVFVESGLLIGLFLPGDSLLFTAGFLASQDYLGIVPLVCAAIIAAILGDNVGYWIGKKFGRAVFSRKGSFFLDPSHVTKAESFYEKYGVRTIILARFVPVVRTLAPVLAGVGAMHWRTFFTYNIIGGILWGGGLTLGGYWLGSAIPGVDKYIIPIVLGIIVVSLLPGIWHILRDRDTRTALIVRARNLFRRSVPGQE
jgi:membrane-associated protein